MRAYLNMLQNETDMISVASTWPTCYAIMVEIMAFLLPIIKCWNTIKTIDTPFPLELFLLVFTYHRQWVVKDYQLSFQHKSNLTPSDDCLKCWAGYFFVYFSPSKRIKEFNFE
jgi:hypothetical protein